MTTSSPGSQSASNVAAMASVAPTVTRTSVSGSSSIPYQARWCAATARRSSGMPALGGYWLLPRRIASAATSFSSSGPSVSGKPWPRLTEPVTVASSDMVAKIVVVNGRRRRASTVSASPARTWERDTRGDGTRHRVRFRAPPRAPIVGGAVLSIANYNMHCGIDGWGRPYDYVAAISSFSADVIVLEEAWTAAGSAEGQADEAARALGYQHVTHAYGKGRRIQPQPDATDTWTARGAFFGRKRPLYLEGLRPFPENVQTLSRWQEAEPGTSSIAVLARPSLLIESTRLVHMSV